MTKAEVEDMILESEERIKRYIKRQLDGMSGGISGNSGNSINNSGALTIPEQEKNAIVHRALKGMVEYVNKEVITRIDNLAEVVNAQTLDGTELVSQYRHRLHQTLGGGEDMLKITGKVESRSARDEREESLSEYRRKTLFFNDDD